jgi:hypothetical protein
MQEAVFYFTCLLSVCGNDKSYATVSYYYTNKTSIYVQLQFFISPFAIQFNVYSLNFFWHISETKFCVPKVISGWFCLKQMSVW